MLDLVDYDCKNIDETTNLCNLIEVKINSITNNADALKRIDPLMSTITEIVKDGRSKNYLMSMRELIE